VKRRIVMFALGEKGGDNERGRGKRGGGEKKKGRRGEEKSSSFCRSRILSSRCSLKEELDGRGKKKKEGGGNKATK